MNVIVTILLWILVILPVYFLPTYVGWSKRNAVAIFMLNLFLGWTFFGWVVALVWSCMED